VTFDYECIIIGNGPAGLSAAIYLRRFNRNCLLVGAGKGRAGWIPKTHNLIGHPNGVTGAKLLAKMNRQVGALKTPRLEGFAKIERVPKGFLVRVGRKKMTSPTVIIATGFKDIQPKIKNVAALRKRGFLRYCPVCDAFEHRHKNIVVFVKDDDGIQRALFMLRFTRRLRIIAVEKFKFTEARKIQFEKMHVSFDEDHIERIAPHGPPNCQIRIKLKKGAPFFADAAYVELGCKVNDFAFKSLKGLRKAKSGFLITTSEQKLSVPGLYAVGDCVNNLGQLSVAAGQAAIAATTIHNELG
jgi:thioredoxin reductase (NADPH)